MTRALVVLGLVAGCNEIYGLDETSVRDPFENDSDFDSVIDAKDNCPDVANAKQEDVDGDGVGDKCDFCPFCMPCENAANHDEDGDLRDDACDNCPGYENPGQENGDGDDLGNACDPSDSVMHHRLFFDGFRTLSPDWLTSSVAWVIDTDGVMPVPGFESVAHKLRQRMIAITAGTSWFVDFGVDVINAPNHAGILLVMNDTNQTQLSCRVGSLTPNSYAVSSNAMPDVSVQFPASDVSRMRMTVSGAIGAQNTRCDVVGLHGTMSGSNFSIKYPLTLELFTGGTPRFRYVDVIGP